MHQVSGLRAIHVPSFSVLASSDTNLPSTKPSNAGSALTLAMLSTLHAPPPFALLSTHSHTSGW